MSDIKLLLVFLRQKSLINFTHLNLQTPNNASKSKTTNNVYVRDSHAHQFTITLKKEFKLQTKSASEVVLRCIHNSHTLWNVVGVIERFVNVHGVVNHVSVIKQIDFGLENILLGVQPFLLQELKQREHEMPVELGRNPLRQIVFRRH